MNYSGMFAGCCKQSELNEIMPCVTRQWLSLETMRVTVHASVSGIFYYEMGHSTIAV